MAKSKPGYVSVFVRIPRSMADVLSEKARDARRSKGSEGSIRLVHSLKNFQIVFNENMAVKENLLIDESGAS